jgi:hypothetical protein
VLGSVSWAELGLLELVWAWIELPQCTLGVTTVVATTWSCAADAGMWFEGVSVLRLLACAYYALAECHKHNAVASSTTPRHVAHASAVAPSQWWLGPVRL